eukprot:6867816-Pyramimonas_sp.AAC.1
MGCVQMRVMLQHVAGPVRTHFRLCGVIVRTCGTTGRERVRERERNRESERERDRETESVRER